MTRLSPNLPLEPSPCSLPFFRIRGGENKEKKKGGEECVIQLRLVPANVLEGRKMFKQWS